MRALTGLLWLGVASAGVPAGGWAQAPAPADASTLTGPMQCFSRRVTNGGDAPFTFVAPAPSGMSGAFAAKGFEQTPCPDGTAMLADFKARMCGLAQGNDAVQARTQVVLGFTAVELCAAARALLPDGGSAAPATPPG